MAYVAGDVTARVDHFLEYCSQEWETVPSYVKEFPTWDESEQLAFVHEWAIRESGLAVLKDYARQHLLTPEQWQRYRDLLAIVARHRPAIDRLLQD